MVEVPAAPVLLRGPLVISIVVASILAPYFWRWLSALSALGWVRLLLATVGVGLLVFDLQTLLMDQSAILHAYLDSIILDDVLRSVFDPETGLLAVGCGTLGGNALMYLLPTTTQQRVRLTQSALWIANEDTVRRILLQPGGWKWLLPEYLRSSWGPQQPQVVVKAPTPPSDGKAEKNNNGRSRSGDFSRYPSTPPSTVETTSVSNNNNNNEGTGECDRSVVGDTAGSFHSDVASSLSAHDDDDDDDDNHGYPAAGNSSNRTSRKSRPRSVQEPDLPINALSKVIVEIFEDRLLNPWMEQLLPSPRRQQHMMLVSGITTILATLIATKQRLTPPSTTTNRRRGVTTVAAASLGVLLLLARNKKLSLGEIIGSSRLALPKIIEHRWKNVAAVFVLWMIGQKNRRGRRNNTHSPTMPAGRY